MFAGELLGKLESKGFDCYAASVAPSSSAHDRACELYAQLTGTKTDYGKAHSEEHGHDRYGTDFTGKALLPAFDSEHKINLLGHAFGGATMRMFASLMAKGDEAEMAVTPADEISPLFTGGKADYIYSLTALSVPHNGTTAYGAPSKDYEEGNVTPCIWNIMPVYRGDHMSLQGGMMKTNLQVYELYTEHFNMINCL